VAGNNVTPKREGRIHRYIRETIGELRKVSWPTWPEARRLTLIVIAVMIFMSLFLWMIDLGATALLAKALGT